MTAIYAETLRVLISPSSPFYTIHPSLAPDLIASNENPAVLNALLPELIPPGFEPVRWDEQEDKVKRRKRERALKE